MNIGFFVKNFSERGTEVAIYDYAHYNEKLLNNKSIIFALANVNKTNVYEKFLKRFPIVLIDSFENIENYFENIHVLHFLCCGSLYSPFTNFNFHNTKTIIHCVFETRCAHLYPNSNYVAISNDLNKRLGTSIPVLPHMVDLPDCKEDLRAILGIPKDSIVFGRYGGKDTFDIQFVQQIVCSINNPNIYFLFMNTNKFCNTNKNIIFLEQQIDPIEKRKFINTCSAMLHARSRGETFGLSCGEFSICGKPIITYGSSYERAHLDILGNKAIIYNSPQELYTILTRFVPYECKGYEQYTPENVMQIFKTLL